MKKIIFVLLILSNSSLYAQANVKMDSWYKSEGDGSKGYVHYLVTEDSGTYRTYTDFRLKVEKTIYSMTTESSSLPDSFLTMIKFRVQGTTDDEKPQKFVFGGAVQKSDLKLMWRTNGSTIETDFPTVTDENLLYLLTRLDYSKKGILLRYNSMELSELHYKPNHYIEYIDNELLQIGSKEIETKRINISGYGIRGSSYWLDSNNRIVKFSIDNEQEKTYTLSKKEEINFEDYK